MTFDKTAYIKEQTENKKELQGLYTDFLTNKTLSDIMPIICNAKTKHNYSLNNTILAYLQGVKLKEDDYIGILNSYKNWETQGESVLKGEKGIKILVPTPKKIYKDKNGDIVKLIDNTDGLITDFITYFKIGHTFDISQTTAYSKYLQDLETKNKTVYSNHDIEFDIVYNWIKSIYQYNIKIDVNNGESKGSYNPSDHTITLHQKSAHTLLHEYSHYLTITEMKITDNNKTLYAKNEILAEVLTYIIMSKIDPNCKYNFNYSNLWAGRLTNEFKIEEFSKLYKNLTNRANNLDIPIKS